MVVWKLHFHIHKLSIHIQISLKLGNLYTTVAYRYFYRTQEKKTNTITNTKKLEVQHEELKGKGETN